MWEGTLARRGNVRSFVGQTKNESVTSTMGQRDYIYRLCSNRPHGYEFLDPPLII